MWDLLFRDLESSVVLGGSAGLEKVSERRADLEGSFWMYWDREMEVMAIWYINIF